MKYFKWMEDMQKQPSKRGICSKANATIFKLTNGQNVNQHTTTWVLLIMAKICLSPKCQCI